MGVAVKLMYRFAATVSLKDKYIWSRDQAIAS